MMEAVDTLRSQDDVETKIGPMRSRGSWQKRACCRVDGGRECTGRWGHGTSMATLTIGQDRCREILRPILHSGRKISFTMVLNGFYRGSWGHTTTAVPSHNETRLTISSSANRSDNGELAANLPRLIHPVRTIPKNWDELIHRRTTCHYRIQRCTENPRLY